MPSSLALLSPRYSLHRYTVYKQGILSFTLFFYNVYNGQSGTPLFDNIITDLFPGTERPAVDYGALDATLKEKSREAGLQPSGSSTARDRCHAQL